MTEHVQSILTEQIQAAGKKRNLGKLQGFGNLARRVFRAKAGSRLPQDVSPFQAESIDMQPQEFRSFTAHEEKALTRDGVHFIDIDGETIEDQQTAKKLFRYITDGGDRLLKLPSIKTRVAIYTDPKKFFIPNSGNKNLPTQEKLAKKDGQELRKRLGLTDDSLDVIIPNEASTLTELIFRYLDETTKQGKGVWLLGPDYAAAQGLRWVHCRTKNPLNESGSDVAIVGIGDSARGVHVGLSGVDSGEDEILVARLIVAKKK